jgi:hypothetical protein
VLYWPRIGLKAISSSSKLRAIFFRYGWRTDGRHEQDDDDDDDNRLKTLLIEVEILDDGDPFIGCAEWFEMLLWKQAGMVSQVG